MSAVDVGGKLEVTSVAVGVAVLTQRTGETAVGTIVESTQVVDENSQPLQGGVQKVEDFLNTNMQFPSGNTTPTVQKVGDFLNTYDGNGKLVSTEPAAKSEISQRIAIDHIQSFRDELPIAAKPGKMGRPLSMTPELIEQICLLLSIGFSRRQAAIYLGISPGSITNAVSRQPAIGEQFGQAEEMQTVQPELTIMAEARKNWRAAAWYLQFKSKNPRPLTEEEKEERHQANLADRRRAAEYSKQLMRDEAATMRAFNEEYAKDRSSKPVPSPQDSLKSIEQQGLRPKKKLRGK